MDNYWIFLLISLLAVVIAVIGYAMIFKVPYRALAISIFTAVLGFAVYDISYHFGAAKILAFFYGSVVISLLAEIFARIIKIPATIILVIGILPLVPGAYFYYTIEYLINGNLNMALYEGLETIGIAIALGMGILCVSTLVRLYSKIKILIKKKDSKNEQIIVIDDDDK